jgi:hypothetical protein
MPARTIEDRLREEYVALLPHARMAAEELEAEVRYLLIPVLRQLASYERIVVKSRVKECESAVAALRRRQQGKFDRGAAITYTLRTLPDLAGVRVLVFPKRRLLQVDETLRARFQDWTPDPVPGIAPGSESMAFKYSGYCYRDTQVCAELQVMAMLIGLFWEVEHGALYKPAPAVLVSEERYGMQQRSYDVIEALCAFEQKFEEIVHAAAIH